MLQPINQDQVQRAAQILLAVLDDEQTKIPGNLVEGVTSGKSLLRGILQGGVIVCENVKPPKVTPDIEPVPELEDPPEDVEDLPYDEAAPEGSE